MEWAFSDESERASLMLVGALFVPSHAMDKSRRAMRALLLPGQRQVHTSDESARRRRMLLDAVGELDGLALIFTLHRSPTINRVAARRLLLDATAGAVLERRAVRWTLDAQHDHQVNVDRATIGQRFRSGDAPPYDHQPASAEPMLWAIDAILWAFGAGHEWRRRIEHLTEVRRLVP